MRDGGCVIGSVRYRSIKWRTLSMTSGLHGFSMAPKAHAKSPGMASGLAVTKTTGFFVSLTTADEILAPPRPVTKIDINERQVGRSLQRRYECLGCVCAVPTTSCPRRSSTLFRSNARSQSSSTTRMRNGFIARPPLGTVMGLNHRHSGPCHSGYLTAIISTWFPPPKRRGRFRDASTPARRGQGGSQGTPDEASHGVSTYASDCDASCAESDF